MVEELSELDKDEVSDGIWAVEPLRFSESECSEDIGKDNYVNVIKESKKGWNQEEDLRKSLKDGEKTSQIARKMDKKILLSIKVREQ